MRETKKNTRIEARLIQMMMEKEEEIDGKGSSKGARSSQSRRKHPNYHQMGEEKEEELESCLSKE